MKLDNEVKMVRFILKMCETMFNNQSKMTDFDVRFADDKQLSLDCTSDSMYVRYRKSFYDNNETLFRIDSSDYINVCANDVWTFNFFDHNTESSNKYSLLNSSDSALDEDEEYIDSLTDDGRILTEDEYFQASLVHPGMPSTYEEAVLKLQVLAERKQYNLKDCSINIYFSDWMDMSFFRMVRRHLMFKTGVEFL